MAKESRSFIRLHQAILAAVLAAVFFLGGCVTVKPKSGDSVPQSSSVTLSSSTDIAAGTLSVTIDGANVPMSCSSTTQCTSTSDLSSVTSGSHTLSYSVAVGCFYCNPNPTVMSDSYPFTVMPAAPTSFTATLSPTRLSVQQGGSVTANLTLSTTLAAANLSVSGVSGISVSPVSISNASSAALTFTAASSATVGSGTLTLTVAPQGTGALPANTATAQLTVTAPPPPPHQLGAFVPATGLSSGSASAPGGQYKVVIGPPPPIGTNAPNATNVATFEQSPNGPAQGYPLAFYTGGGVQFCANGSANLGYGVVFSPNPPNANLGTNADAIYWFQALPNNFQTFRDDVYTSSQNGVSISATTVSFSPDCTLVLVTDIDHGNGVKRATVYRLTPTPGVSVGSVEYNNSVSASVVSGGTNGSVQFTFDGTQTRVFTIN